jgi:hypothetical protein
MRACCSASGGRRALRRASGALAWLAPILTLALLPKCPLCLAAWFALFTGVALPPGAASTLRAMLIAASTIALALLAIRRAHLVRRALTRPRSPR